MTNFFLKLVNMSVNASWLILAVFAARLLLKKAPRWISVLLWGLVGLRLICPFNVESALSLVPKADIVSPAVMAPAAAPVQSNVPATGTVTGAVSAPVTGQTAAPVPNISADQNPLQIWFSVLTTAWCAGVAFLLLHAAVSYGRLRRKVRTAVRYQDNVFQSESVTSPFILGILQPRIYLPFSLAENEIPSVLAHEKSHLARLDHWWKPAGYLLLTVYWFNPLMWVSYVLLGRDIELACDERVIRKMTSDQRAHYSQTLLGCSTNKSQTVTCPLAFGEVGVKERIKSVLHYKKPAFWVTVAAVFACIAVAVCFLTSPKDAKAEQPFLDLNRNGIKEELRRTDEDGHFQTVEILENGERIFYEEGESVHSGWNALFLCTLDEESYLLRYNPVIYQGACAYTYELFTLENGGRTVAKNELSFDVNFDAPYHDEIDTEDVAAFLGEVNGYLSHAEQLLNTDANLLQAFRHAGRLEDDLSYILNEYQTEGFTPDDAKTPAENLALLEKTLLSMPVVSGIEAVLHHGAQFLYLHDDKESSMELRDVPSFLDPDDDYGLALQSYSLTDLDGDGVSEAVIPIFGIAGDQSRFLVLHEIGEWVYGYFFSYRDFEDLKADGTYHYSDPTGTREQGICRITGFTEKDCIIDKITYGTGTYEGLTEFVVEYQPATEEAFLDALSLQSEKTGAAWYAFP